MVAATEIGSAYKPYGKLRKKICDNALTVESTVTNSQFQAIKILASTAPDRGYSCNFTEVKKRLNEMSQSRSLKWGNTIRGSRLKRLAAADDKARLTEVNSL